MSVPAAAAAAAAATAAAVKSVPVGPAMFNLVTDVMKPKWAPMPAFMYNAFLDAFPIFKINFLPFDGAFESMDASLVFVREYMWLPYVISAIYLLFVVFGQKYLKSREAFDLSLPLQCWNGFLAVFSICGMIRSVPVALFYLYNYGMDTSLCAQGVAAWGHKAMGVWTAFFVFSKIFELIDTVFLVLRKKPVSLLHWLHHVTVLCYCWEAMARETFSGIYFLAMNYTVHAVMYGYYFLATVMKSPPKWGKAVTIMQIVQMVIGAYISFRSVYFSATLPHTKALPMSIINGKEKFTWATVEKHGCHAPSVSSYMGATIYAIYLYLFVQFFVSRYIKKSSHHSSAKKAVKSE